jgi:hypothetical protein
MNFYLILIILNSSGSSITSQTVKFYSQTACLKAMQKVVETEKRFTVRAVCVQESL